MCARGSYFIWCAIMLSHFYVSNYNFFFLNFIRNSDQIDHFLWINDTIFYIYIFFRSPISSRSTIDSVNFAVINKSQSEFRKRNVDKLTPKSFSRYSFKLKWKLIKKTSRLTIISIFFLAFAIWNKLVVPHQWTPPAIHADKCFLKWIRTNFNITYNFVIITAARIPRYRFLNFEIAVKIRNYLE